MNKVTRILLAVGLILAVATPALAEFKFNGFYRLLGYTEEKKSTVDDEGDSQQFIDQRFRAKLTYTLNENVSVVYFAEIDTPWGEPGSSTKYPGGQGGVSSSFAGGADGVNIETKNVYLDLKFGDTAAQVGIIGVADAFQSIVANDDMAAVAVTQKLGSTTLKGVYSKWDEDGNERSDWDDFDFYVLEASNKFNDNFTAGAGVYWMDDNRDDLDGTEIFFYGLNADARFGKFGIDGFVVMQDGENETANQDIEGLAASVKGKVKLDNGDFGLRLIYFTDDDDADDQGRWAGFKGQYEFVGENQMQFLCDPFVMNDGKERYALNDAVGGGYGLMAAVLSGNHKLPSAMYLKWGVGYYRALEDQADDNAATNREGKTLGYEVAARFGKTYFDKVDVSLNASWAEYGNFYDDTVNGTDDPDGTYKTYLMVNVPF